MPFRRRETRTATIASGQTTSAEIDLGSMYSLCGVQFTAAITGATLTFTASPTSGGTFTAVKDSDGNAVSLPSNAAGSIGLSAAESDALYPWRFIKLVSASAEGADRTIPLIVIG